MRLFRTRVLLAALSLSCLALFLACDGFFTTSLGSWLARDIDYSSLSLDELLQLASTRGVTNADEAKKILAALASMSEDELAGLTVAQKSTILETAINATFSMDSVLSLVDSVTDENADSALEQLYSLANSDVDMTAVAIILQDEETLASADVDTILLAGAAYVISESSNADDIEDVLADTTITNLVDAVSGREDDLLNSTFGDYLDDILGNN